MGHPAKAEDSRSLRTRIAATDAALRQHRLQCSRMVAALDNRLRSQVTSPTAISVAAGFGFLLGRRRSSGSNGLLNLLKTATQATLLHRALQ